MKNHITRMDLLRIFLRCFFVQGSWNFKALLGVGFCFCVVPVAKRLYDDPEEQEDFLRRHLCFFNAHPYFASWCIGAVTKLEEEAEQKEWPDYQPILIFKDRLVGPLGIIGDKLFWSGLKPMAAAIGISIAFYVGWIATPIYLLIYNIPHIYTRFLGLQLGYKQGFDIVSQLSMRHFDKYVNWISAIGLFFGGVVLVGGAVWTLNRDVSVLVAFIISVVLAGYQSYKRKSVNYILLTVTFVSIVVGVLMQL